MIKASKLYSMITQIVEQYLDRRGMPGSGKGTIPASYGGSGNIPIQRAWETSSNLGSKTHKIVGTWSNRTGLKPAASQSIHYAWDADGNRFPIGPIVDASAIMIDAEAVMGLRPTAPGNSLLLSHDAEVSTTSSTYVDTANKFHVTRCGSYRLKVELARSGGMTSVRAVRKLKDGTVVVLGPAVTQNTLTYPTFGAVQSADFTTPVGWDDIIYIQMLNDSGPAQTGYMKNCRIYYSDATAAITPFDQAL